MLKIRKPPFKFFRTVRVFKVLTLSDIRFSQCISTEYFFQYCLNFGGRVSKILRYIRIFDVISELYCVLLRRGQRFENKKSHLSQHAVSDYWRYIRNICFTEEEEEVRKSRALSEFDFISEVILFFFGSVKFVRKNPWHFVVLFLSLKRDADLCRSRLVNCKDESAVSSSRSFSSLSYNLFWRNVIRCVKFFQLIF